MKLLFNRWFYVLQDKAGGEGAGGGGGAGGSAGGDAGGSGNKSGDADTATKLDAALKRADALEERLKKLEGNNSSGAGGGNGKGADGKDLADKAREEREAADKQNLNQSKLESALKFNLGSSQWLKDNATLLPKTIQGIFDQAAKENYANAIEKDQAVKTGIISEFFSIQANVDLLTPGLKAALDDFNKLTKNVKQERAQSIYDSVFEPAFDKLKSVKKAEQLSRGVVDPTDAEAAYKAKLIGVSKKHYLGEKQNGS
jgi:hypothetical protein